MEKFEGFKKKLLDKAEKDVTDSDILKNLDFYVNKAKAESENDEVKYYYQKVKLRKVTEKKKIKEVKKIIKESSEDRIIPHKKSGGVLDKYRNEKIMKKIRK